MIMAHNVEITPDPLDAFWREDLRATRNMLRSAAIAAACVLVCASLTVWVCLI